MASRLRTLLVVGVLGALCAGPALKAQQPPPEGSVLPNFDVRFSAPRTADIVNPDVRGAIEGLQRDHGREIQLRTGRGGAIRTLAAQGRPLAFADTATPQSAALEFIGRYHRAFGLEARDLGTLVATRQYSSGGDPLVHLEFRQVSRGLRVFGAELRVHVTRDGRVVRASSSLARTRGQRPEPGLDPAEAAGAALSHVRSGLTLRPRVLREPRGAAQRTVFARGPLASNLPVELVWFPSGIGLQLAWHAVVEPPEGAQKYDVLVDANTGELLYRRNRILYAEGSGRILQSEATASRDPRLVDARPAGGAPSGGQDVPGGCPPVVNHEHRDLVAPFLDPTTVLGDTGRLAGNNVRVFRGAVGVDGAAGTTGPDGSWLFDFPFGSPAAGETHLFYLSNFLHDFFYELGFDEAAGNFQVDNFGRGGRGGDHLVAVAQANGRNNATFEPKPDGQSPIMSMFLWDGTGCWSGDVDGDGVDDLDGSLDSDIAIHEFHHGVSHRLNTEFTGAEADAIGEGGSDFFAYSINGDTSLAEYSYPPYGIRQVNGRTYGSWWCWFDIFCEPHDNGEIWANVMWDLRERLRSDLVDGSEEAGVRAAHLLYVDALKLSPPSPTMLDLRDALVQADQLRRPSDDPGGSVNHCRIWEVFALRGMGAAARDTHDTGAYRVVEDFSMPAECGPLPPSASVSIVAPTATAFEAGAQPGTFAITRTGDTSRPLTVYLGAPFGSAVEGTDYAALPAHVVIPAGADTVSLDVVPIDDASIEANETVTLSLGPGPGYTIAAPSSATVTIVSDDVAADLVVMAVAGPTMSAAGATITLTDTTRNQGTGEAAPTATHYFLSANTFLDPADVLIGGRDVPALAAGASDAGGASATIPSETAAGIYYVIAKADATDVVSENSEANNTRFFVLRVGPDLVVTALSVPSVAAAGDTISVTDTTQNQGGGDAVGSSTVFYLSANAVLDASDVSLGSRAVAPLAPGASHTATTMLTLPADLTAGTYYLLAQADGTSVVAEPLESNNLRSAPVRVGSDLVVSALTAPSTSGAGATITVNDTTKNQGGTTAVPSLTRLYLSVDLLLDASDVPLGSRAVPSLAAGASSAGSTTVVVPADTAPGLYYVVAQADADDTNVETSEANNIGRTPVRVGPDLIVTSVVVPATGAAGGTITVTETVKNQGGGPADASSTRLFLSTNSSLDASDQALGTRVVSALAPGAVSTGSTVVTIPPGMAAGLYYVLALADANSQVNETTETNNTGMAQIRLGADLILTAFTAAPTATGAGATVNITDTTKNNGGSAGPSSTTRFYLSADIIYSAEDVPLGGRTVPALGAGATSTATTPITLPADTVTGTWYLIALADADDAVDETSETNNLRWTTVRVGPDLRVSSLTGPSSITQGNAFSVTETTRNDGGAPSPASTTRFYLSVNSLFDAADLEIGARAVPLLAGGGSHAATTVLAAPVGTAPGRYYLIARADADDGIPEVSETNNNFWILVTVN